MCLQKQGQKSLQTWIVKKSEMKPKREIKKQKQLEQFSSSYLKYSNDFFVF